MTVVQYKVELAPGAIERLEETLALLEDARWMVLEDKLAGRAWLAGYFETRTSAQTAWQGLIGMADGRWFSGEPEMNELAEVDWRESYKAHFKAWKFGRLNWVPVWERGTFVLPPAEEVLWLDPGLAFGTGNHETTRLCCERLVKFVEKGRPPQDRRREAATLIDAGCGSGILALSAAKLGHFARITGFDHDPEAVHVSEENAALNDLAGRVEFFVSDLRSGLAGRQANLVLANIQADVLMKFAHELTGAVAPGGELVLSGILTRELPQVRECFAAVVHDWAVDSREMGEWADLGLTRLS
ncbi:MAG: 50S ribosomal protein L11 methyltransferase [Opitutaceae bacterium]|nr:50S ribosomal protein L11 methyltransferase [Opitutaceae bacterium]